LRDVQAKYGDLGYAFANVIPRTRVREQDREVDITFEIDKGNKVYIGKINVIGNTKTRDKVLRRELRIREGELYHETRKRESFDNIKRLGYFEEVNFNVKTPKGHNDLIDIDIVVKERNTGTIQVGAGYSSFQGFVLNGQVNQINLNGRGQKLGASVDISKKQSLFKFSFTEPYFNDTEWSLGGDIYQSRRVLPEYSETKKGGAVRVGHPLAPYLDGYLRYKLDDTDLKLDEQLGDPQLMPVESARGITSSVTATLEYDKRDDRFAPTKGVFSSLSLEYAGLGGDKKYTKGFANFRFYKKMFWDIVWRNNFAYGFISSNEKGTDVPFNELFLLGGANSLRGFDWYSVGKRKFSNRAYASAQAAGLTGQDAYNAALRPFGGMQQIYYNLEFQFNLINEAGIKGVVFYDIGDANDSLTITDLRQDVGFGFRWFSPIGPLRFEWGFPLDRKEQFKEDPVNFQFAIGSPF
jgi:outer membrane protein insertion porin family